MLKTCRLEISPFFVLHHRSRGAVLPSPTTLRHVLSWASGPVPANRAQRSLNTFPETRVHCLTYLPIGNQAATLKRQREQAKQVSAVQRPTLASRGHRSSQGKGPPGVCAAGTGLPGSAAGTVEDACWRGARRHRPAAERLPPEEQGVQTFSILRVGESSSF